MEGMAKASMLGCQKGLETGQATEAKRNRLSALLLVVAPLGGSGNNQKVGRR